MSKRTTGFLAILITAAIFGFFGVFIRLLSDGFGTQTQVGMRGLAAGLIALTIVFYKKVKFHVPRNKYLPFTVYLIAFPISLIFFTAAVVSTKATTSIFMLYSGSIAAGILLGSIFLKERLSLQKTVAVGLAIVGLIVFVNPFALGSLTLGVAFGILAGVFEGSVHVARKFLSELPREMLIASQYLFTGWLSLSLALLSGETMFMNVDLVTIIVVVIFGACLVMIGWLLLYGFKYFDVNTGTIVLASELFFAAVINMIFLNEVPMTNEIFGGFIIFVAAIIAGVDFQQIIAYFTNARAAKKIEEGK